MANQRVTSKTVLDHRTCPPPTTGETMPLRSPAPLQDPIATFLRRTPPLTETPSPQQPTLSTLRQHASSYEWAHVLQQSTQLLSDDHHPPHETLSIHTYRALALLQTRQSKRARDAINALGDLSEDNPQYRYESYERYSERGCFVPFLLRLVDIDIRFRHRDMSAITHAYRLLNNVQDVEKEVVLSALASYHLKTGLYDTAIDLTKQLVQHRNSDSQSLLVLTRLYIHLYDLENAKLTLEKARNTTATPAALSAHAAMLLAAQGRYRDALTEYDAAIEHDDCWVYAMNNSAICLLQLGYLENAVERLENAIRKDPVKALDEGLVFNLATLYQLAYPDSVVEKKRVLRKIAERFGRQGFDLEGVGL